MNISIKIRISKSKLSIRFKKNKPTMQTEKILEAIPNNDALMFNPILSRNLKHLSFIDKLEMSLSKDESKHLVFSKQLNDIKRIAQINTHNYLTKCMNQYKIIES